MVKIILNGCNGKMGKIVTNTVKNYDDVTICAGVDKNASSSDYPIFEDIKSCNEKADVILDFSRPDALYGLLSYAGKNSLPIVLCTTGYDKKQIDMINSYSQKIGIFRSANMSIGINVINNILKKISPLLYENFDIEIIEKHHNQKVDAPSGTALMLSNTIKNSLSENTKFIYGREGIKKREHNEIGIHAIRGGSIVGEHEIIFAGQGETIEIKHTAISREVFAIGAIKACNFMYGKKQGLYSMDDVVKLI